MQQRFLCAHKDSRITDIVGIGKAKVKRKTKEFESTSRNEKKNHLTRKNEETSLCWKILFLKLVSLCVYRTCCAIHRILPAFDPFPTRMHALKSLFSFVHRRLFNFPLKLYWVSYASIAFKWMNEQFLQLSRLLNYNFGKTNYIYLWCNDAKKASKVKRSQNVVLHFIYAKII